MKHVLNLGAGVQSTALYLLAADKDEDFAQWPVDVAIFADVGEEPDAVYQHLEWLQTIGGPPILVRKLKEERLGDTLIQLEDSTRQRCASIPAFTKDPVSKSVGMTRRQCTKEWKVDVVERTIRRDIFGLEKGARMPHNAVMQYLGFSTDEAGRAGRARGRFDQRGWTNVAFPLIEMGWSRYDCTEYLKDRVPHTVARSACVFCPYKNNKEWLDLKRNDPAGWTRAVEVDEGMRKEGAVSARAFDSHLYIHRSCKPLVECGFDEDQTEFGFMTECEGGCGL